MMDHLGKETEDTCQALSRLNATLKRSNAALRSLAETIERRNSRRRGQK
jgi:hypothetical protein